MHVYNIVFKSATTNRHHYHQPSLNDMGPAVPWKVCDNFITSRQLDIRCPNFCLPPRMVEKEAYRDHKMTVGIGKHTLSPMQFKLTDQEARSTTMNPSRKPVWCSILQGTTYLVVSDIKYFIFTGEPVIDKVFISTWKCTLVFKYSIRHYRMHLRFASVQEA